ncbi:rod shape-determining protein MreC [Rhizorhapis sp. SPR117]|uniref:rod shape-determining protein MreC n=1 Tax=Rhizorhapis sp. SPR117 TaxID=2912611 RepID=UPI001F215FEE|nr:rod shape-determining protein MreC [Rhizorhapis sp. SPR117]
MAPPPSRRPGHNRKAQYGLFVSYVIAVAGALLGLLLIIISVIDPTGFAVIRNSAAEITRPVSATLRTLVSGIGSADEQILAYVRAGSQNAALRRQVDANRTRIIEAAAIEQENRQLKRLLKLTESENDKTIAAHMISSTASSTRRFARLSAGRRQGVMPGQPVRAGEGLIGRIYEAGPNTANILLLTDPENIVPIRRARDNVAGISTGRGDGSVEIRPISMAKNPFRPGDTMVTSGTGGLYRPNIPVAIILRIDGDTAIAIPLANPARVDTVIVQQIFQPSIMGDVEDPLNEADLRNQSGQTEP